jgi:cell division protein FtsQ
MAVTAPEDRRFRRGRQAPSQRRRRRSRYWVVIARVSTVIGVLVLVGALAWGVAAFASTLRVGRIVVQGNVHLSTAEVLSLLDGLLGDSMLNTDLEAWRQRLHQSPWVADAALSRALPDAIEVTVIERQPLAVGRLDRQLVLVDADGVVIDEYGPRYAVFDLPIVDGLAQPAGAPGTPLQGPRAKVTARLLADLAADRALLAKVSQADVSDPHNVVVWLEGDHARLLLGDREFRARLASYLDLRASLLARISEMDYVDLRFGNRVFVRPAGGTEVAVSGSGAGRAVRAPS